MESIRGARFNNRAGRFPFKPARRGADFPKVRTGDPGGGESFGYGFHRDRRSRLFGDGGGAERVVNLPGDAGKGAGSENDVDCLADRLSFGAEGENAGGDYGVHRVVIGRCAQRLPHAAPCVNAFFRFSFRLYFSGVIVARIPVSRWR